MDQMFEIISDELGLFSPNVGHGVERRLMPEWEMVN